MIKDTLANAALYASAHPRFKAAFDWLAKNAAPAPAEGKAEIDGDRLAYNSQRYATHPFDYRKFETHVKYIDIQFVVSGSETIYLGDPAKMETAVEFNEAKDIKFLAGRGAGVALNAGEFMIIWPHEAHAPGCDPADAEESAVQKIIIKVAV